MFTKVMPAGDLFAYVVSERDAMRRKREFPAELMRGQAAAATRVLWALAPAGVAPGSRGRFGVTLPERPGCRRRLPSDWVRHCEQHLVHFISCFHESRKRVEAGLPRIIRATEDLMAVGLRRNALHFAWYKHPKKLGTHAHGGMLRAILFDGKPYDPQLDPALLRRFDRLMSRRLGFADPLSPAGSRMVYAAWGSAKPENEVDIEQICERADAWWRAQPRRLARHQDLLTLIKELGYQLLAGPDQSGEAQIWCEPIHREVRIPRFRNTVVVASRDHRRAICFKGPACRFNFDPEEVEAKLEDRRTAVVALRENPQSVFDEFAELLIARSVAQHALWDDAEAPRIDVDDFRWLLEEPETRPTETEQQYRDELAQLDLLARWSERGFPFPNEEECQPGLLPPGERVGPPADLTDPDGGPLGELIDEELAQLAEDELAAEVPALKKAAPPEARNVSPPPATVIVEPAPAPAAPRPDGNRSETDGSPPAAQTPNPANNLELRPPRQAEVTAPRKRRRRRLRLAVQVSLAVARNVSHGPAGPLQSIE